MPRMIGAEEGMDVLHTYVDASYAIHSDMKGHTGGLLTMGLGIIQGKATKQKLNAKSSTEAELIGASDYIPWTVWVKWFLKDQGYKLRRSIFYQDNQSAMKMESNGMKSAGDKSRHINIRFFFIKDILKREGIELLHCRTERMIADYYTKPLQESLFKKMRDIVMGLAPFPDEERVELIDNESSVASVKCASTENNSTEIINLDARKRGLKSTSMSYADVLQGNRQKMRVNESHALGGLSTNYKQKMRVDESPTLGRLSRIKNPNRS